VRKHEDLLLFFSRDVSLKRFPYLEKANAFRGLQVSFALNVMKTLRERECLSLVLSQWRDITFRVT
jgi:hypothetical protein